MTGNGQNNVLVMGTPAPESVLTTGMPDNMTLFKRGPWKEGGRWLRCRGWAAYVKGGACAAPAGRVRKPPVWSLLFVIGKTDG